MERKIISQVIFRRPGGPRAIPENLILVIISLYQSGSGYRAITRELRKKDISVDWSTVRRAIKAQLRKTNQNHVETNSDTILTLHRSRKVT